MDDQAKKMAKLELEKQALALERDELIRNRKDREAKVQELTRKLALEKD